MAESYQKKVYARLNQDVFPTIGNIHIKDVSVPDLLGILRRIEERGAIETAHRALWSCSQIIKYAIVTGRAEIDISIGLSTALSPTKKGNFAAITDPLEAKHLLLAIDAYTGSFVVKTALQLSPHFFVRPGELRNAKWEQFDFDRLE
jgi:integrase